MQRFLVDPSDPDIAAIAAAAEFLRAGAVVAYPTDTLYGLAVDPYSEEAVGRLFEIKGRDGSAAIPLIAADLQQAQQAGSLGPAEARLAAVFWPGPLGIVMPAAPGIARRVSGERGTLAIRVPAHPVARTLAAMFGRCITATSANLSGHPAAVTGDEVAAALGDLIDALVDGGPSPGGPPSTIVEVVEGRAVLHRAGAVPWDRVLESLQ